MNELGRNYSFWDEKIMSIIDEKVAHDLFKWCLTHKYLYSTKIRVIRQGKATKKYSRIYEQEEGERVRGQRYLVIIESKINEVLVAMITTAINDVCTVF